MGNSILVHELTNWSPVMKFKEHENFQNALLDIAPLIFTRKVFTYANYDEGDSLCCLLFHPDATFTQ